MAEFGAIGLVLGLWIALAHQHGPLARRRDGTLVVLGWVLLALSVVLIVTSGFPTDLTGLTSDITTDGTTAASSVTAGGFGLQLLNGAQGAPTDPNPTDPNPTDPNPTEPSPAGSAGGSDGPTPGNS
jgi:hypothetical protein